MELELLVGYKDESGVVHTSCEFDLINGDIEEKMAKSKTNGSKMLKVGFDACCTKIGTYVKAGLKKKEWDNIINSLLAQDIDYAMMQVRRESYGETIDIKHKCKNCKNKLETTFNIDDIEVNPFLGDWTIEFELPVGVKNKDGEVCKNGIIRIPNIVDREIIEPITKTNMASATTMLLARCVTSIEGMTNITNDLFRKMVARDREYLLKLLNENNFGCDFHMSFTCPNCGEEFEGLVNVVNFI